MRATLATELGRLKLPTPVLVAAGCLRSVKDLHGLVDLHKVGGIVTTSVTLEPRAGAPNPRICETPSGILYSIGMQNPGVEAFIQGELPALLKVGIPVIVSVAGATVDEFVKVAGSLNHVPSVAGIEVNLAVPDAERGGVFSQSPSRASEIAGAVARHTRFPVFAKLAAETPDVVETAGACAEAGVAGVTLLSGVPGMAMSVARRRPQLGTGIGRVGGPAVKPFAMRAVFEVAQAHPEVPIMACGGVRSGGDALEMILAGAWAVQVGTAMLVEPTAPLEIARGILRYQRAMGIEDPAGIRTRREAT